MEYLLVDLENITPETLADVPDSQFVYVLAGEKQTRFSTNLAASIVNRVGGAKLLQIKGDGKNALDLHIAYLLGKLSEKEPGATFQILSKDKGFDPLVLYLNSEKIGCTRIESIFKKTTKNVATPLNLESFVAHLEEIGEKLRPKKVAKLKAYLKNWATKDESLVDPIFNGLLSKWHIKIDGEKVKYFGPV